MKRIIPIILSATVIFSCSQEQQKSAALSLASWGDQGNGTYINPILNADYSDPDVIRVDETYYMVASDFHFMGIQLLRSGDLVNWEFVTRIYDRIDAPGYDSMERYSSGSWAPTIRWHDGKFYVFFCTPDDGLYMTCSEKPEGPWSKLHLVHEGTGSGWEDPCPFWDEDGTAYLGRSRVGAGPIILHRMSPDGKELLDEGTTVYEGDIAEGTKIHKLNGWYYLSIPEGGVETGWQTVLRSRNIYGPYERKVVLETGMTDVNGPHQGALVDTPDGKWWFFHFQRTQTIGRVVHLQPVFWRDEWPVIGVDMDRNGIGEPVYCWKMPVSDSTPSKPASSDDFESAELGVQWQFNHNPVDGGWSLTEKPGCLAIHALKAESFLKARNSITQKLMGYKGTISVELDLSQISDGQHCGLALMGDCNRVIGIRCNEGTKELYFEENGIVSDSTKISVSDIRLKLCFDTKEDDFHFQYDDKDFGRHFQPRFGFWKGVRPALYSYNVKEDSGTAFFDNFEFIYE